MKALPRSLGKAQTCQVWTYDTVTGQSCMVDQTSDILLETPNWVGNALILNGDGKLWQSPICNRSTFPASRR